MTMEIQEEHVVNLTFIKSNGGNEAGVFKEIINILDKEIHKIGVNKVRFSDKQIVLIKGLNEVLNNHEAFTDKTDNQEHSQE